MYKAILTLSGDSSLAYAEAASVVVEEKQILAFADPNQPKEASRGVLQNQDRYKILIKVKRSKRRGSHIVVVDDLLLSFIGNPRKRE